MLFSRGKTVLYKSVDKLAQIFYKDGIKYNTILCIVNGILLGLTYAFVANKAILGVVSVGAVLKHVGVIQRFYTGIINLISDINELRVNTMFFSSSRQFFGLQTSTKKISSNNSIDFSSIEFEFHNVSFFYPNATEPALSNLSFKLSGNQKIALVGLNGSGKTTLIHLLCRLYEPTSGYITLNGIDIANYDLETYWKVFSVVFQDYHVFSFGLDETISSNTQTDNRRLREILDKLALQERISLLKNQERTCINQNYDANGVDFSGGEKQKIAIARAMYKNAPVFILDEPTASLDPISEYEIYTNMDQLIQNKMVIYISHRLASCRFCDEIIVLENGVMTQRGKHEELIVDKRGKYAELWNAQAKYYQ